MGKKRDAENAERRVLGLPDLTDLIPTIINFVYRKLNDFEYARSPAVLYAVLNERCLPLYIGSGSLTRAMGLSQRGELTHYLHLMKMRGATPLLQLCPLPSKDKALEAERAAGELAADAKIGLYNRIYPGSQGNASLYPYIFEYYPFMIEEDETEEIIAERWTTISARIYYKYQHLSESVRQKHHRLTSVSLELREHFRKLGMPIKD